MLHTSVIIVSSCHGAKQ